MYKAKKKSISSIYESFSDLALMALGTFVFLFVTIVITSKLTEITEIPMLKEKIAQLENQVKSSQAAKDRYKLDMQKILTEDPETRDQTILDAAGVGRKDFDLFIEGLRNIPGKDLHLVVDATGSMHGVSGFLVPILRLIATRTSSDAASGSTSSE